MSNNSHPTFIDPYGSGDTLQRCSIWLDRDHWQFLERLDPNNKHFRQTTISILFSRLIEQLQKHGITQYDPRAAKNAVGGITITIGIGSPGGTVVNSNANQTPIGNERRGVESVSSISSNSSPQHGSVERTPCQPKQRKTKCIGDKAK